jgi:threonyl-tRNA synthetase
MNCPHHCEICTTLVLQRFTKSYAEFGTVYRYEQSGELHGLTRVRGLLKMMHIFFRTTDEEFKKVIDLVLYVFVH